MYYIYMCNCVICDKYLHKEFNFFCRPCYRSYMKLLKITNQDFINYINLSFKCNLSLKNTYYGFSFRMIYDVLKLKYDLINLDMILENILYLKLITCTHKIFLDKFKLIKPKHRRYIQFIY